MEGVEILGALLVWVLCGIAGAMIASQKGRSAGGWAVLCFLLGPLGVILALVASRDEAGLEAQALESGDSRKCPQCAEIIKSEATKCRYCGSELEPLPEPQEGGPCFVCGFIIRDHKVPICPNCGRKDPLAGPAGSREGVSWKDG